MTDALEQAALSQLDILFPKLFINKSHPKAVSPYQALRQSIAPDYSAKELNTLLRELYKLYIEQTPYEEAVRVVHQKINVPESFDVASLLQFAIIYGCAMEYTLGLVKNVREQQLATADKSETRVPIKKRSLIASAGYKQQVLAESRSPLMTALKDIGLSDTMAARRVDELRNGIWDVIRCQSQGVSC